MCDELFHTFCVFLKSHKDKRSFQFSSVWNVRRLSQHGRHLNSPVSTGCKQPCVQKLPGYSESYIDAPRNSPTPVGSWLLALGSPAPSLAVGWSSIGFFPTKLIRSLTPDKLLRYFLHELIDCTAQRSFTKLPALKHPSPPSGSPPSNAW